MKTFLVVFLLLGALSFALTQTIVQSYPFPNTTYWNQAYGLAADSSGLCVSSTTSTTSLYNYGRIYKLDSLAQILDSTSSTSITLGQSQGLAFDGADFYYVRRYTSSCTVIKVSPAGTVIDSMRFGPSRYVGGAAWGGTHLWVSLYYPNPGRLLKVDWSTKTIVDSVWTIGDQPTGVAWDGQYVYYAMDVFSSEPNLNLIYVVDPALHDTVRTIPAPEAQSTDSNLRGLAWDGRYLWLIARPVGGGTGQVLYKYDLGGAGTPAINLPVSFFDFGVVQTDTSRDMTATVQNVGTADLTIDSLSVTFSNRFTTDLSTPATIPPAGSLNFAITFAPQTYGVDSAHIILYNNDILRGPQTIRVIGTGNYPPPVINVPTSYDFGTRRSGSSTLWIMTAQNQGAQTLVIDSAKFTVGQFRVDSAAFPLSVVPVSSRTLRIWFEPNSATSFSDTMRLYSNAGNLPVAPVALSGQGDATPYPLGSAFWTMTVPLHPISNTTRRVRAIRSIGDITGDGQPDVIVCTDNYWTMAVNGNASGTNDSLWGFSSYVSSYSAGPVGSEGDYSYEKDLAIASDLNGDGYNDVVIGTGGGNEHVYAINGKTGQMLWTFGTDSPDSFSLGDITGVDVSTDFNSDGVPDVVAASAASGVGGLGGRRSLYLFNGASGSLLWQAPLLGFTHAVTVISDVTGDGIPDVVATIGEPSYRASAFNGATGAWLWDYPLTSGSGGAKELLPLPVPGQHPDVVLGTFWGPVYRINGQTGAMVWERSTGGKDATRLARLPDINDDGIDEIVLSLLVGDAWCLDGASGNILWYYPANSGMDITVIPDLNNDGYDEVAVASQNADVLILQGDNGQLMYQYALPGSEQARAVGAFPDLDGNGHDEIVGGSDGSRVVMISGGSPPVSVQEKRLPDEFALSNGYPNPFNPTTSFRFDVPRAVDVDMVVFDILGRKVRSMHLENLAAGSHTIRWDGKNDDGQTVASGVYAFRVVAADKLHHTVFSSTRKAMMLK